MLIALATGKKTAGSQTAEDPVVREVTVASLGVPVLLQGGRGIGAGGLQQQNPNMRDPNMRDPNMRDPNMRDPNMRDPRNPNIRNPNLQQPRPNR